MKEKIKKIFLPIFAIVTVLATIVVFFGKLFGENIVIGTMVIWALICIIGYWFFGFK